MKKTLILLFIICMALPLGGCRSLLADRREVEQLRVMQTLGLDSGPGGVVVTLANSPGEEEGAVCVSGVGPSISAALENARRHAAGSEIFTGHLQYLLIGEGAARQGVEDYLSYVCRSFDLRMDMPLFVLREAEARSAMSGVDGQGVTALLQNVEARLESRGDGRISTVGEVLQGLEKRNSALVCALRCGPSAELLPAAAEESASGSGEQPPSALSLSDAGFGVLLSGKLKEWLEPEIAAGVGFLLNDAGLCELVLRDRAGAPVTVEIDRGGSRVRPLWDEDGSLRALELYVKVSAVVLEADSKARISAGAYADDLTGRLETAVSEQIGETLRLARAMRSDFLGLGDRVEQAAPLAYRRMGQDFSSLLPTLEMSIAVQGELLHSSDLD